MAEEKTTKIKKKRWFQIVGPRLFREAVLGETYTAELESMKDKTLKVNLMALTNDMKQQNVNIKFQIDEIRGDKAHSQVIGYEIIPATIRRLVRRAKKRMDISFVCETSNKIAVKIKPFVITKKTMKSSVNAAIRKSIIDYLTHNVKKMNYDDLVNNLVSHRLQRSMRDNIRKIYPLRICEIKEMSIVKETAPEGEVKELVKPKETPQKAEKKEAKEEKKEVKREEPKKEAPKPEKKEEVKAEKKEVQKDSKEVSETQRVSEHAQKSTISDKKK